MPSPGPIARPSRRAADRQAALRDRSLVNRRIVLGAFGLGLFIVLLFYWNRVGGDPVRDGGPGWSPDGSQIVFHSEQPGGKADLFLMESDGTRQRRVLETPDDERNPAFSPDGRQIAFESDRDGNVEIYVVDVDGEGLRRVTNDPGRDTAPAWSPDGEWLAFTSDRTRPDLDLFRVRIDGTGLERLTQSGSNGFPQFSPVDPPRLAFHNFRDVYVLGLASGLLSRLTTEPLDGMYPSWSPDSSEIAFMSARNGATEIFTMKADGSEQRRLVSMPSGSAVGPRWSPTGQDIAFVHVPEAATDAAEADGMERAIYVVEIATGKLTRLSR